MLINAVVIMTGTVSFYIFVVMSSPLPIRQGMKCVEDDVFRALKTNSSNALDLCRAYINETVVTVMKKEVRFSLHRIFLWILLERFHGLLILNPDNNAADS